MHVSLALALMLLLLYRCAVRTELLPYYGTMQVQL
jgi:hypothetical protein